MNTPQTLKELLDLAVQQRSASGRQMAMLAQGHGFAVTSTTINQIRSGSYKSTPSVETIRAIAWLAGVSDEVAFTAAGQPVPGPPLADELPPGTDNLSPKSRKAVIEMLRVLIDLEASSHDDQEQPETNPSGERTTGEVGRSGGVVSGQKMDSLFEANVQSQLSGAASSSVDTRFVDDEEREALSMRSPDDEELPDFSKLAAHPNFVRDRDRFDEAHGQVGEESQARPEQD